jgi:hypothetical protein
MATVHHYTTAAFSRVNYMNPVPQVEGIHTSYQHYMVHGLALGFRICRVSASLSFCHGGPLLWWTQTKGMRHTESSQP